MFLLDELHRRYVFVTAVRAPHARWFGASRWSWLRPVDAALSGAANEGSMVVHVEAAGRRVLLCGDVEAGTIEGLARTHAGLRADVVELPHHGSHHRGAEAFVVSLAPRVALQSTGVTRWQRTRARWRLALAGVEHLVTARDGACWVEIDREGEIRWGRYDDRDHERELDDPGCRAAERRRVLGRER
jgi:beta-lactamase superfamily II metal-dependent hydrolase